MEKLTRIIKNCTTGEETIVELTDQEVADLEQMRTLALQEENERLAAINAKAAAKASAEAKLAALGLTAEEIAAL